MRGKRIVLRGFGGFLAVVLVAAIAFSFVRPSNDRDWKTEHARLPSAAFDGNLVHITGIRDFHYTSADSFTAGYYDRTFDLDSLATVWLGIAVFNESERRGPAHSLLSFGFDNGDYVAISVEARKEVGEDYSTVQGLFKKYEIIYVIGDERDLLLTRAVHRPDDVYLYPIKASREKVRELFVSMLEKANALHDEPEFYNTLTNNCTSKLRDHVNMIAPGLVPHSWKLILPGYADELVKELGLLGEDVTIEEARRRYWINGRARLYAEAPDFSQRIRRVTGRGAPR